MACDPTAALAGMFATGRVHVYVPLVPAWTAVAAGKTADTTAAPLSFTVHELGVALDVPELVKTTVQTPVALTHVVTCPLTCAELVNDPNRPNTNPAMAMAAMRVIAMRMTVASTGEMAFLFFL